MLFTLCHMHLSISIRNKVVLLYCCYTFLGLTVTKKSCSKMVSRQLKRGGNWSKPIVFLLLHSQLSMVTFAGNSLIRGNQARWRVAIATERTAPDPTEMQSQCNTTYVILEVKKPLCTQPLKTTVMKIMAALHSLMRTCLPFQQINFVHSRLISMTSMSALQLMKHLSEN